MTRVDTNIGSKMAMAAKQGMATTNPRSMLMLHDVLTHLPASVQHSSTRELHTVLVCRSHGCIELTLLDCSTGPTDVDPNPVAVAKWGAVVLNRKPVGNPVGKSGRDWGWERAHERRGQPRPCVAVAFCRIA